MASSSASWGLLSDSAGPLPVSFSAILCDLRPRFLEKGQIGRGYRAIARNGKVLLAIDRPLADLANRNAWVRIQTWHKAILPNDSPMPYGILLCIRTQRPEVGEPRYRARLVPRCEAPVDLGVDVGGDCVLEFRREERE
jgi:hypothetical protein